MIQITSEQVNKIKQLMDEVANADTPQDGEFTLSSIIDMYPSVPRTTLQNRLSILVRSGKLFVRKSGQTNFYRLVDGGVL